MFFCSIAPGRKRMMISSSDIIANVGFCAVEAKGILRLFISLEAAPVASSSCLWNSEPRVTCFHFCFLPSFWYGEGQASNSYDELPSSPSGFWSEHPGEWKHLEILSSSCSLIPIWTATGPWSLCLRVARVEGWGEPGSPNTAATWHLEPQCYWGTCLSSWFHMLLGCDSEKERKCYVVSLASRKITLEPLGFMLAQAMLWEARELPERTFGWGAGAAPRWRVPQRKLGLLLGIMKPHLPISPMRTEVLTQLN